MIVYISGPMTGYVDFNRDAFFAAEKHLSDKGFTVVNPAALDAADGSDVVIQPHAYYMRRDLKALLDCDLIYLLPGWRYSKGALTEKTVADVCGILRLEDPDVDTWRSFEGEPENAAHAEARDLDDLDACGDTQGPIPKLDGEILLCTKPEGHDMPHEAEGAWWEPKAEDLSPQDGESEGHSEAGDGDLSDHPRYGTVFADIAEPLRALANGGIIVSPPPLPARSRCLLAEISRPRPDDSFPNVGYVRRFKRILGVEA